MIRQRAVYYFHNDQLGSPLKLTDNSQNVAWEGVRAPFGEISVTTNAVENPLRFPGQYSDEETGKLYATDTATCNGISRMRGKRSGAVCHSSASERYAACLAGRPIPPLNTWNN